MPNIFLFQSDKFQAPFALNQISASQVSKHSWWSVFEKQLLDHETLEKRYIMSMLGRCSATSKHLDINFFNKAGEDRIGWSFSKSIYIVDAELSCPLRLQGQKTVKIPFHYNVPLLREVAWDHSSQPHAWSKLSLSERKIIVVIWLLKYLVGYELKIDDRTQLYTYIIQKNYNLLSSDTSCRLSLISSHFLANSSSMSVLEITRFLK